MILYVSPQVVHHIDTGIKLVFASSHTQPVGSEIPIPLPLPYTLVACEKEANGKQDK
jgi:hypothetical protein